MIINKQWIYVYNIPHGWCIVYAALHHIMINIKTIAENVYIFFILKIFVFQFYFVILKSIYTYAYIGVKNIGPTLLAIFLNA